VLPQAKVVAEYAAAVPDGFRFGVKMPNALTLTHFHQVVKTDPWVPNPHFLSREVLKVFLDRLEPMREKLGPMMLQFGYLNRSMIPSQGGFLEKLGAFVEQLPAGYMWAIETRNPNHLNAAHFGFLREHGLANVFQQGYFMPPVSEVYEKFAGQLTDNAIIRLHGKDREGIEQRSGKDWSKILEPHDADLDALVKMVKDLAVRRRAVWVFANNHFEGCAPITIERIKERLGSKE